MNSLLLLGRFRESIIDDTSALRQPEVGDILRSDFDDIQIVEVAPQETFNGKTDRAVAFKVIKVHSPEDSNMSFDNEPILYGDLVHDRAYEYLDEMETEEIECSRCGGDGLVISAGPHPSICVGVLATDPCPECA